MTDQAIQSENGIKTANNIQAGVTIRIPGGGSSTSYTVQAGDMLSSIASRYSTTDAALQKLNNIKNHDIIYAGQVLKIKGTTKKATPKKKTTAKYHTVKSGDQ